MYYYKAILKENVLYYFYKETNIVVHVVENKNKKTKKQKNKKTKNN
jgi:predicted glycosyltransferase